jgi:hypothetical protein
LTDSFFLLLAKQSHKQKKGFKKEASLKTGFSIFYATKMVYSVISATWFSRTFPFEDLRHHDRFLTIRSNARERLTGDKKKPRIQPSMTIKD